MYISIDMKCKSYRMICYIFKALSLRLGDNKLFIRFTRRDFMMWCCAKKNSCKLSIENVWRHVWNGNWSRIKLYRIITYMRDMQIIWHCKFNHNLSAAYILHLINKWNIFKVSVTQNYKTYAWTIATPWICISSREIYSYNDNNSQSSTCDWWNTCVNDN